MHLTLWQCLLRLLSKSTLNLNVWLDHRSLGVAGVEILILDELLGLIYIGLLIIYTGLGADVTGLSSHYFSLALAQLPPCSFANLIHLTCVNRMGLFC